MGNRMNAAEFSCGHKDAFMKRISCFLIDNCLFGVDTAYIHDVLPIKEMTRIPQQKSQYFNRVMQLEDNRFVHVINTDKLLGVSNAPSSDDTRMLVLHIGGINAGLVVDRIERLLDVDDAAIMAHQSLSAIPPQFLSGIITDMDKIIILLNIEKIATAISGNGD